MDKADIKIKGYLERASKVLGVTGAPLDERAYVELTKCLIEVARWIQKEEEKLV